MMYQQNSFFFYYYISYIYVFSPPELIVYVDGVMKIRWGLLDWFGYAGMPGMICPACVGVEKVQHRHSTNYSISTTIQTLISLTVISVFKEINFIDIQSTNSNNISKHKTIERKFKKHYFILSI